MHGRGSGLALAALVGYVASATLTGCPKGQPVLACQIDEDCKAYGAVCSSGFCELSFNVSVSSPGDGAATNGVVRLSALVTAPIGSNADTPSPPAEVQFTVDDDPLVKVPPPYSYDWNTTDFAQGQHEVRAVVIAGTAEYKSPPIHVVVDRIPPDAPTVTAPASSNDSSAVTLSGVTETGTTVSISEGGRVLQQSLASGAGPSTGLSPWTLELTLGQGTYHLQIVATDPAGNASAAAQTTVVVSHLPPMPVIYVAAHTRSTVVPVTGTAEASATVALSVDGASPQQVPVDGAGHWSTTVSGLSEGTHTLSAQATDALGNVSPQVTASVAVDRTRPQVASTTPGSSAVNVWTRDAIRVTFTEVMDASTFVSSTPSSTGTVTYSTGSGGVQGVDLSLSTDGKTLTIVPPLPDVSHGSTSATVSLKATSITDLAGNVLLVQASIDQLGPPYTWSWTIPDWQDLSSSALRVTFFGDVPPIRLVVDAAGTPTVGFPTSAFNGTARTWNGSQWIAPHSMGDVSYSGDRFSGPTLVLDPAGSPVIGDDDRGVAHWDGTNWEQHNVTGSFVTVAADATGVIAELILYNPQVFTEAPPPRIERWDPLSLWATLSSPPSGTGFLITFDAQNRLVAAGCTTVGNTAVINQSFWSNGAWSMGPSFPPFPAPCSSLRTIILTRPDDAVVLSISGVFSKASPGGDWATLGNILPRGNAPGCSANLCDGTSTVDSQGGTYRAWMDATAGGGVQKWVNGAWVSLGGTLLPATGNVIMPPIIAAGPTGMVTAIWPSPSGDTIIKRYNGY
jgi:hypothetical protein